MSQAATLPRGHTTGRELGWWGMVALVMTEAMLFALLLFSFFYLRAQAAQWPPAGIADPELPISAVRTALLLASSLTIAWADRGIRAGRQGRLRWGLVATFVLAGVFLAGHVQEAAQLLGEFTWRTNAYGSLWYVITNFHAAHLAVGMAMIAFTYAAARSGAFAAERDLGVRVTSIYWHFVDVVWVAVYSSLYLLPHVS